jgi:hypothetical protein
MRGNEKRVPGIHSVIQPANELSGSDRVPLGRSSLGQGWKHSSYLATRASLLTLIGHTAHAQAVPAFSGVEISANPSSVRFSQDRVDLVIAIAKNATLDEIQLFLPRAKQILRNGQQFALIETYPDQKQALSSGLALQDSLPWPLELLIYNVSRSPEPPRTSTPRATTEVPTSAQFPGATSFAAGASISQSASQAQQPRPQRNAAANGPSNSASADAARPQTESAASQTIAPLQADPKKFSASELLVANSGSAAEAKNQDGLSNRLQAISTSPQPIATGRKNKSKASELGGELSASAMGLAHPLLFLATDSSPEPASSGATDPATPGIGPAQATSQPSPTAPASSTVASAVRAVPQQAVSKPDAASASTPPSRETTVTTSVIIPPLLSEKPLIIASNATQLPLDPAPAAKAAAGEVTAAPYINNSTQTQAAVGSTAPDISRSNVTPTADVASTAPAIQLSTSSTSTTTDFMAIRPDLDYLGVIIRSDQDLEVLRKFATVSEVGSLDGVTIAKIGVYARSRIGQNLMRLRLLQIRQAGLTPEVISTRVNSPASLG